MNNQTTRNTQQIPLSAKTLTHFLHHLCRLFQRARASAGLEQGPTECLPSAGLAANHWSVLLPLFTKLELRLSALLMAGVRPPEMWDLVADDVLLVSFQFPELSGSEALPVAIRLAQCPEGGPRRIVHLKPTESVLLTLSMPAQGEPLFPGKLHHVFAGMFAKATSLGIRVADLVGHRRGSEIVAKDNCECAVPAKGDAEDLLLVYRSLPPETPQHLRMWVEGWVASLTETLTLDLATQTGWALLKHGKMVDFGTLVLATVEETDEQKKSGADRTGDVRFSRLLDFIERQVRSGVKRIVFEDVQFMLSSAQAQLWPSLRSAVWAVARSSSVEIQCVPSTTLKTFATGSASAKKSDMAEALARTDTSAYTWNPEALVLVRQGKELDHNQVDAIWLARYVAAVDKGEQQFIYPAQRKAAQQTGKRAKHAANVAAAKATGRCCGILRKPGPFGRAVCRKCGRFVKFPIKTSD
jgi:hypothetical protein